MVKIEDGPNPLYMLSQEELGRLTQGVALDLLAQALAIELDPHGGARVRFRSAGEADKVRSYIA